MTPPLRFPGRVLGSAVIGVSVAFVGTGIHRVNPPWGIALALLIVFSAAVMARAWARRSGVLALGTAVVVTVLAMARYGTGGDVIIAAQPVGYVWLASGVTVAAVVLLPRRWFSDEPIIRRSEQSVQAP